MLYDFIGSAWRYSERKLLHSISIQWILVILLLIYLFVKLFRQTFRIIWLMIRLPGPPGQLILGHPNWILDPKRFNELRDTFRTLYGPVIRMWNFIVPGVLITDPKDIEKILGSSKHLQKPFYYYFFKPLLGDGILTSEVSIWRNHRKLLLPYFHIKNIEEYISVFNKGSELLNKAFEYQLEKSFNFNITSFVNKTVFCILIETIFGLDLDPDTAFKEVGSFPHKPTTNNFADVFFKPWIWFDFIYRRTNEVRKENDIKNSRESFTKKILKDRHEMRQKGLIKNKCFLDFLSDICDNSFTEDDCIKQSDTFILAGQDSVATTTAFCLHQIAQNAEVQKKIVTELELIFGDSERYPSATDIREMIYLEQCIKETMRLYPAVPVIFRTLGSDVEMGNYTIPKGCTVLILPWLTHFLDEFYPNPKVFNPDHFERSKCENRHPYAFLPFSAGPRNCIGYKFAIIIMKTIISNVLRKYTLTPVAGKEKLNAVCRLVMRASGGVWITLTPKEQKKICKPSYDIS